MAGLIGGSPQIKAPAVQIAAAEPDPTELARQRAERERRKRGRSELVVDAGVRVPANQTGLAIPTGGGQ